MIERLVDRAIGQAAARRRGGDTALAARARRLASTYVAGAEPTSVQWSSRMRRRYGSCSPSTGEIRISQRLAGAPDWVLDYILVHELAHLLVADHSPAFEEIVMRYPRTERARGWLLGYDAGRLDAARHVGDNSTLNAVADEDAAVGESAATPSPR